MSLYIDGTLERTLSGIDNDTLRVDEVRLGPSTGLDSGTSGTFYLDGFESRRSTYTLAPAAKRSGVGPLAGLLPGGRSHLAALRHSLRSQGRLLPQASQRNPGFFARLTTRMHRALVAAFLPGMLVQPAAAVLSAPPAGQTWKTYYSAGGLVAMREITAGGSVLYYLHQDHLGSTSLATNASGAEVPNTRQSYYPFGAVRVEGSALPTDKTFTGQYADASTGLYFYNARYYSSAVGRFVSADTIVPGNARSSGGVTTLGFDRDTRLTPLTTDFHEFIDQVGEENRTIIQYGLFSQWGEDVRKEHPVPTGASNPQALNRYSYVINNPLRYTDPTGHCFLVCLFTGVVGAVAGFVGSAVSQFVTTGSVDWGDAVIAGGAGFIAGAAAPISFPVAIVSSAAANMGQYVATQLNHGNPINSTGVMLSGVIGVGAGLVAGPASQQANKLLFQIRPEQGLKETLTRTVLNETARLSGTIAKSNFIRSFTAGLISNLPLPDMNPARR